MLNPAKKENIERAISFVQARSFARIVREVNGFIVTAFNESDYEQKVAAIERGETYGLTTVSEVIEDPALIRYEIHSLLLGRRPKSKDVMKKVYEYINTTIDTMAKDIEAIDRVEVDYIKHSEEGNTFSGSRTRETMVPLNSVLSIINNFKKRP